MKVEILNQYTQVWEVDEQVQKDVFRTNETLEQLQERLDLEGYVIDGKWEYDGVVAVVSGIIQDAQESVSRVKEFNKKPFGRKGYYTLDEIMNSDLAWVDEYGIVDDKKKFEHEFKVAAQKK